MGSSSHFMDEDKINERSNYHGWKMYLDMTLEDREVLDYVKGKLPEPSSNALAATKNKYTKGEVKVKNINRYFHWQAFGGLHIRSKHLQGYLRQIGKNVQG